MHLLSSTETPLEAKMRLQSGLSVLQHYFLYLLTPSPRGSMAFFFLITLFLHFLLRNRGILGSFCAELPSPPLLAPASGTAVLSIPKPNRWLLPLGFPSGSGLNGFLGTCELLTLLCLESPI